VERWGRACQSERSVSMSPVERADREEAIAEWLTAHAAAPEAAAVLVDTALSLDDLESLATTVDAGALNATLEWLAAACSSRALAVEVAKSTKRIHDLVAAVKRFTYMDRAAVPEAVDLSISLSDSVALLQHKARGKSARVVLDLEPNLPRVRAIGSDLNQIWTNLLDNAIDAVGESGEVTITAARRLDFVIVHVVDNGPGIPPHVRDQVFDPFFTTKPVGQGTGLGLDITRRLVRRNDGDIEVESRPGRTEFQVTLPVASERSGASRQS
jgi:signal transduction histidine kinase